MAALGLTRYGRTAVIGRPRLGLRRDLRLRRRADFDSVYKGGRIFNDPLLVLRTLPNNLDHNRYGFVTSKRLGGAVVRNRVRRRLREIVRSQDRGPDPQAECDKPTNLQTDKPADAGQGSGVVGQGYDIVLSAKVATVGATFLELSSAVRRLFVKGGLLEMEAGS